MGSTGGLRSRICLLKLSTIHCQNIIITQTRAGLNSKNDVRPG